MIRRSLLLKIKDSLFTGKTILLLGPRQVGKSTLLEMLSHETDEKLLWFNGDNPEDREILNGMNSTKARQMFQDHAIVVIDEAQRLENSGLTIKIIHDNCKEIQIIATGSSSFELSDKIKEALTGRKWTFNLFPMSLKELKDNSGLPDLYRTLENRMIYGSYPDILNRPGNERLALQELVSDYLYKDLLMLKGTRKPEVLEKLVKALAYQVGNQVSNRELSDLLKIDKDTVEKYISLLEEAFIIFRLPSFASNLRNELKQSKKIYFIDNGIRNAVINQFNPLSLRTDTGTLWENLMISERLKYNRYNQRFVNCYFWRTTAQQEIDYLEESDGNLAAFEFKWKARKTMKFPGAFLKAYPNATQTLVDKDHFEVFTGL